ncbi:WXG100 family type VII secretion target [Microbacterium sp. NPDC090007]|uniref:WXG100 family type VII secretion target n=1 Tax=Microbacterium sp. NPDC090007 TaxID=3364204 RepID=UPI00380080E9
MTIRFDGARHTELVERLRGAVLAISQHLDDLDKAVSAGRTQWTGEARDAYDVAHGEWSRSLERLTAALTSATHSLEQTGRAFDAVESTVARLWA